jgi:threonine dehydratase
VISGQGTAALEAIHQMALIDEKVDYFICPVGGGGLMAGCCIAIKHYFEQCNIIGVEPELFNDTQLSLSKGKRVSIDINQNTLCDALMAKTPGKLTFPINQEFITEVATVNEQEIKEAMRFAYNEFNLVVEPGGIVGLASAMKHRFSIENANILILLSGGNVDLDRFDELIK